MSTKAHIIDYVVTTISRNGKKNHLQDFAEKLEGTVAEATLFHTLAMGWNFYHHVRPSIPRGKLVQQLYISFHGFRIFLDERIPPNMCEMRDTEGTVIKKYFWSA